MTNTQKHNPKILTALNIVHAYIASNTVDNLDNLIPLTDPVCNYYGKGFGYGVSATFTDSDRAENNEVVLSVTLNEGKFTSAIFYNDNFETMPCNSLGELTQRAKRGLMDKHVINASIH